MFKLIDTHCHIYSEYYDNLNDIILKNKDILMINCAAEIANFEEIIELTKLNSNIYGALGIHPNSVVGLNKNYLDILEKVIKYKKIIAIGEIGLDYYYTKKNKDKQIKVFKEQLNLARKYKLPVLIHSRDADEDMFNILSEYRDLKKVLHCYSSSYEMALRFIKIGCLLGIGGVITFNNALKLKEVVEKIDIEHLIIETDSPYLTPVPFRGQKNEPKYVEYVVKEISEIKNMHYDEVLRLTNLNAIALFDLDISKC